MVVGETQTINKEKDGIVDEKPIVQGMEGTEESNDSHMFVCGQCNLGFTNIEECKQHMVKVNYQNVTCWNCVDEDESFKGEI